MWKIFLLSIFLIICSDSGDVSIFVLQKNTKMVIEDCSEALRLNPKYLKALTRRATACEQSGDLTQALEGMPCRYFLSNIVIYSCNLTYRVTKNQFMLVRLCVIFYH